MTQSNQHSPVCMCVMHLLNASLNVLLNACLNVLLNACLNVCLKVSFQFILCTTAFSGSTLNAVQGSWLCCCKCIWILIRFVSV